jgi:FkbH-like protein
MFEIDQYDGKLHQTEPLSPIAPYSPADNIDKMSLLFWGEHCTECAAPSCYQTCDLYEPRPDSRCRRFLFGVYKNRKFDSVRGYAAEVLFKKWGVFAATGNTAMVSKRQLLWTERVVGMVAPALNFTAPVMRRLTRDERWTYPTFGLARRICSWLHRRNGGKTKPDAFLLEVFNPAEPVQVQLAMDYAPTTHQSPESTVQIRPRFRTTLRFPRGYSRHEIDQRLFQGFTDGSLPFNISLTPEADTSLRLVVISADFVAYRVKPSRAAAAPAIKCVVWDLDNTMWDGTLVETDDVRLKPNVKEIVQALDQRGILLSIASKNNHEFAWRRLEELGLAEYFLVPQINWTPKSESLRAIAKRLNIGLDSFAFVDDSPFELAEVGRALPEVLCIDTKDVEQLRTDDRFQGSTTADAGKRRQYYQEALVREDVQTQFGDDYRRFLEYCEIKVEIRPYQFQDFDRVSELIQRTNQLNFSGRKYQREELQTIFGEAGLAKFILYCSDRFGSYGLIGFSMVRQATGEEVTVQDLMLSCRVQGKLVEEAFLSHLEIDHNAAGVKRLKVIFNETKRNQPARQVLERAGFKPSEDGSGFVRDIGTSAGQADVIHVSCGACAQSSDLVEVETPLCR